MLGARARTLAPALHVASKRRFPSRHLAARRVLVRASPEQSDRPSTGPQDTSEDPAAALAACIGHIEAGDLDALLEFVPDEVIDKVIEMRRCNIGGGEPSWLRFTDVLQANASSLLYLDSYAIRHLAHGVPRSLRLLSAVRVSGDRYLQRCAVVSHSGEEAVMSFEMVQQECLESQYRGPPLMRKRWMLRSVHGESSSDAALPAHPSPSYAPEAVLQAQLAALREHSFVDVFAHASPANKSATGPVQQFARMLQSPAYAPLLGHQGVETLQRLQPSPTVFMELVRVYPSSGVQTRLQQQQPAAGRKDGRKGQEPVGVTYLWVLSRQNESSPFKGCWMVDSVQPVDSLPLLPAA